MRYILETCLLFVALAFTLSNGEICGDDMHECVTGYCCKNEGIWKCCLYGNCDCDETGNSDNETGWWTTYHSIGLVSFFVFVGVAICSAACYRQRRTRGKIIDRQILVRAEGGQST